MKFFIASSDREGTLDAFPTFRTARDAVLASGSPGHVDLVEVPVTGESIRRLLSGRGGYATEFCQVWETPQCQN